MNELLDAWLKVITPTAKRRYVANSKGELRHYVREGIGKLRLSRVRTIHIQALVTDLEERKLKRAPSQTLTILKRVFAVAI